MKFSSISAETLDSITGSSKLIVFGSVFQQIQLPIITGGELEGVLDFIA